MVTSGIVQQKAVSDPNQIFYSIFYSDFRFLIYISGGIPVKLHFLTQNCLFTAVQILYYNKCFGPGPSSGFLLESKNDQKWLHGYRATWLCCMFQTWHCKDQSLARPHAPVQYCTSVTDPAVSSSATAAHARFKVDEPPFFRLWKWYENMIAQVGVYYRQARFLFYTAPLLSSFFAFFHISILFSHCLSLHILSRVPITNQSGSLPAFCLNAELNLSHGMCTTTYQKSTKVKTHSHKCVYNVSEQSPEANLAVVLTECE